MYPYEQSLAFAPRPAMPAPTEGVFDEMLQGLGINSKWLSHILGVLEALNVDDAWVGTDEEVFAARQEVEKLMAALSGDYVVPFSMPVGTILEYGATSLPAGWLACDGAAVSRTTYEALFNIIGITFGAGNGTTTFNLPDLKGRAPIGTGTGTGLSARALGVKVGAETHQLITAELASHAHNRNSSGFQEAVIRSGSTGGTVNLASGGGQIINATTTAGAGSNTPHNNIQPSIALTFMIYAGQ